MLCTEEMGTLLSRYVDGELADKERKSIEAHLETCASCRDVLNLFQRNDNVLNNALVGEAFGAQTVDAVMTEIRRLEEPMVVAPAVDEEPTAAPPVAMRQVIQVTRMWPFAAAAALMITCLGGFLAVAKFAGFGTSDRAALEGQLDQARKAAQEAQENSHNIAQVMIDRLDVLNQQFREAEARANLQLTKEATPLAYVGADRSIVVQANFSTEKFGPFQVFRAREISNGRFDNWSTLSSGIATPYFVDTNMEPGVNYMYQIRALYRGGPDKFVDSAPVVLMFPLPGGLDPRTSLRIRFIASLPDMSQATFQVSRYEGGKQVSHLYNVKIGEKIGDVQSIDGKRIDFSTRLVLQSVQSVEDAIGIGPTPLPRMTRQAILKPESRSGQDQGGFPLRLDVPQYIPLPK